MELVPTFAKLMMALSIEKYLLQQLALREQQGNKRSLFLRADGIDFFSNDYLGLALNHRELRKDKPLKSGATGSRLLSGNSAAAEALESFLAGFHQTEAALLFNSGYDANLGLISAVGNRHTTLLYDEHCHASLLDGIRLSYARQHFRFKHNDLTDLKEKLDKHTRSGLPVLVVVESVYSMEGDMAPLADIAQYCQQYQAALIVDEAHATGIIGCQGAGLVQQLDLHTQVFARIHTFGKAIGAHGAVIVGSGPLKEYLINFARSFIYTTALAPAAVQAIRSAYDTMIGDEAGRKQLQANIEAFKRLKTASGWHWHPSDTPIQSLFIGDNQQTRKIVQVCEQEHINLAAILSPTVAKGTERIRICLHSFNTDTELEKLFKVLEKCLKK